MEKVIKKVTCRDLDGNGYEVDADELMFRPSVYGVVVKDGKIMLSKQYDGYDFPGGGLDKGETFEQGLIREYKEETGYDVEVGELLWHQETFYHNPKYGVAGYWHGLLYYYRCEIVSGEASIAGAMPDELEYMGLPEWVDFDAANVVKWYTSANVKKILELAKK